MNSLILVTSLLLMAATASLQFAISQALKESYETTEGILLFSIVLGISLHIGLFLTAINRSKTNAKRFTLAVMMLPATIILLAITGEGIIDAISKFRFVKPIQWVALIALLVYGVAYYSLRPQSKAQPPILLK